jgi:hypothetical protein
MHPAKKEDGFLRFEEVARYLGVCDNYTEEAQRLMVELKKENVVQGYFYLVNSDVSLTGLCVVRDGVLYASGEVGVCGLDIYPCKSGTAVPCRKAKGGSKLRSLSDIAKDNFVTILQIRTRPNHPRDLHFFAKRVPTIERVVQGAVEKVLAAQKEANKFAWPTRFRR